MPEKTKDVYYTSANTRSSFNHFARRCTALLAKVHTGRFSQVRDVYNARPIRQGFFGTSFRELLVIKRSDALSYEIYLEWIDWYKPLEDGSYDRSTYPRATPQAATILKAKSYEATMVELVYNFKTRKFELWFNIHARHQQHVDTWITT